VLLIIILSSRISQWWRKQTPKPWRRRKRSNKWPQLCRSIRRYQHVIWRRLARSDRRQHQYEISINKGDHLHIFIILFQCRFSLLLQCPFNSYSTKEEASLISHDCDPKTKRTEKKNKKGKETNYRKRCFLYQNVFYRKQCRRRLPYDDISISC